MMTGSLTTHVLDIAQGCPAANMSIALWRLDSDSSGSQCLKTVRTDADGRTALPLLAGDEMIVGTYELTFSVGEYFAAQEKLDVSTAFLNLVPVRFCIADPSAHYHVPLLTSPWAYSTYRGS
jgi:5-hydroxyisourate hydrolase